MTINNIFRHYSTYAVEYLLNKSFTMTKCTNNTHCPKNEKPLHMLCSPIYISILIKSPWLHFPTKMCIKTISSPV